MSAPRCVAHWRACPDHGNTLVADGGWCRCTVCGRRWPGGRLGADCDEPAVVAIVVDGIVDPAHRFCAGHALAAREQTPPWVQLIPVPPAASAPTTPARSH